MVKTKKTQVAGKRVTNGRLADSLKTKAEVDMLGEDGWVTVKKQKVNVFVPPLRTVKNSISSSPGRAQPQELPQKTANEPSQFPIETDAQIPEQEKLPALASEKNVEIATPITPEHIPAFIRQPIPESRVEPENLDRTGTSKTGKLNGVSNTNTPKAIRRPRALHCPDRFFGGGILLNQRMRASNLERKLQRAGGLSKWLASLGLGQFVGLFHGRRSLSKFQLVNLTMKKLKDMGADKVGPRRKLMHAIDCICEPYCFEALKNGY